ncbi:hypothetical protein I79_022676 [Cricetulus griseus]|uniref:Uncharacterized protein n=1 Tax=Cricetulus griseus TaxID=10029 RepID=G3IFZ9_CRIGR|nr:hypothetical protein I79_022676 [Cricetulus griseus]
MKKGTGQETCGQFPIIILIYAQKAENILVLMSARTGHTQLSGLLTLAVPLCHMCPMSQPMCPMCQPAADTCVPKATWTMKGRFEATS